MLTRALGDDTLAPSYGLDVAAIQAGAAQQRRYRLVVLDGPDAGRFTAVDGRPVSPSDYADPRARRLATREFNLSWSTELQGDNQVVAGRWWPEQPGEAQISVEEGLAATLGLAPETARV